MLIDISPILQAVIGTAATVVSLSGPVIAMAIIRKLHLEGNEAAIASVNRAAQTGAGLAYAALVAESNKPASVEIKSAALATGLNHMIQSVPAAMTRAGITEDTAARMIAGRLGSLLAQDATVHAGPSAAMPPPGVVPVSTIGETTP